MSSSREGAGESLVGDGTEGGHGEVVWAQNGMEGMEDDPSLYVNLLRILVDLYHPVSNGKGGGVGNVRRGGGRDR